MRRGRADPVRRSAAGLATIARKNRAACSVGVAASVQGAGLDITDDRERRWPALPADTGVGSGLEATRRRDR